MRCERSLTIMPLLSSEKTNRTKHHGYSGMHGAWRRLWGGSQGIKALHVTLYRGGGTGQWPSLPPHVVIADETKTREFI